MSKVSITVNSTRQKASQSLDSLLRRGDIWRGESQRFLPSEGVDTGFSQLNRSLVGKGWPKSQLIEIQAKSWPSAEWYITLPCLSKSLMTPQRYLFLLNPPALPCTYFLLQNKVSLHKVIVVYANNKQDFMASFCEMSQLPHCAALFAWPGRVHFNYTDIRKLQLSALQGDGLNFLWKLRAQKKENLPVSLRMDMDIQNEGISLQIIKQRGIFKHSQILLNPLLPWQQESFMSTKASGQQQRF